MVLVSTMMSDRCCLPSHPPSGAALLALELSEEARGISGLDVLRRASTASRQSSPLTRQLTCPPHGGRRQTGCGEFVVAALQDESAPPRARRHHRAAGRPCP